MQVLYLIFSIPAILNIWLCTAKQVRGAWPTAIQIFIGAIASFGAVICLVPISINEETDYLTLGILTFALNMALAPVQMVIVKFNGVENTKLGNSLRLILLSVAGICALILRFKSPGR